MRRDQSLRRASDFRAVRSHGASWADHRLVLAARPRGGEYGGERPPSRFGFTVSKRMGNAVARNRIRRRLRAAVMDAGVERGWDVVLIARRGAIGSDYAGITRSVRGLLERAGIGAAR